MKIATTALAFLIAAGSPLWASGLGTNMDCEIDIFWDTDSNTEPTQAELDWAGEKLRYYFNFVSQETADGDFDMSSEESTGVDISKNHAEATFDGIASCNACDWSDDDAHVLDSQATFMDILNNSPFDKALWIETFFDELIQGPYEVFWDAEYYPDSWDVTMTCDPPLADVKTVQETANEFRAVASKADTFKVPVDKDAADTEAADVKIVKEFRAVASKADKIVTEFRAVASKADKIVEEFRAVASKAVPFKVYVDKDAADAEAADAVSGLGTNMDCEIDIFWDTDSNTEPTQAELDWAGEKLRYYFNFVSQETADGDFDMSSEESTGVDISKNHAEATFDGIASCNACDWSDDDAHVLDFQATFMDILNNSPFDKALWIETFFDELIQGPYEVFWDAEYYPDSWDVTMTCDPPLTDVKIAKKGLRAVASKAVKVPVDKDAADTEATDVGAAAD